MTTEATGSRHQRMQALDGLRGIAITLVVLSHGWTLWPMDSIRSSPLAGLFRSGNLAVTIFLVIGGFLLMRSLLSEIDRTTKLDVVQAAGRRYLRISAHVYALIVLVLIVHAVDETEAQQYPNTDLVGSIFQIAKYTWNEWLISHALVARPDLGHLWYISAYMQITIMLVLLVWVVNRVSLNPRAVLASILGGLFLIAIPWKFYYVSTHDIADSLLRTATRADAMVLGALAAVALPWVRDRVRARAATMIPASLAVLVLVLLTTGHDESYLRWVGLALNIATVAFLLAVVNAEGNPIWIRPMEWRPLVSLGRASMSIFVWHYPVFWAVARHSPGWSWPLRAAVAVAITALLVVVAQRLIEEPLQRWLAAKRTPHDKLEPHETDVSSTTPAPEVHEPRD